MKEIRIEEIGGFCIGQTENAEAGTGCTVVIAPQGMRAGLDVRGGGPASRETQLLNPLMAAQVIHGIVLGGGSAYGLNAAGGVMKLLEERDIGLSVGPTRVPLVVQSDIFDLSVGDPFTRPDADMGYEAAKRALDAPNYRDGNFGAGCGATVGKMGGRKTAMKTGIGSYAVQVGDLKVGALIVLNAVGDIFDWKTGKQAAGVLTEDHTGFRRSADIMRERYEESLTAAETNRSEDISSESAGSTSSGSALTTNTTLGILFTNAYFEKAALCKIAGMGHDGYARSINPVHTSGDGDSLYAVSTGDIKAPQDLVGVLGAEVVSEAILRAVKSAEGAFGMKAYRDLNFTETF
ncbi:MAG: P1 family peptidase [Lachnospiraceae bacterium]|nr:P1 family peptidase [Lachnospiraceae bacterium]